jgi:purine-binding chemotaxis protein CheW
VGDIVEQSVREILIVELGGQRYGLRASQVRELVRAVAIRPLPSDSTVIEGVIDVRGVVVPVLDLRARLHLPSKAVEPSDHLVILEAGGSGGPMAVRVDRAIELFASDAAALEPVHDILPGWEDAAEVARLPDGLVPMLDLRRLIATARSAPRPATLDRAE